MFLGCLDLMVGSEFSSGETGDGFTMNFPTEKHRVGFKQHISFQPGFYPRDQLQLGRRKQDSSIQLYCIVFCLVLTLANGVVDLNFGSEFSSDPTGDGPGPVDDEVFVQDSGVNPNQTSNESVRLISARQSDHIQRNLIPAETKEEMISEETNEELNTRRRSGRLLSRARREAEDVRTIVDATAAVRRKNRSGARRAATRTAIADATAVVRNENGSGVRRVATLAVSETGSESVDAPAPNHLRAEQVLHEEFLSLEDETFGPTSKKFDSTKPASSYFVYNKGG
jgi:hypothetical protein